MNDRNAHVPFGGVVFPSDAIVRKVAETTGVDGARYRQMALSVRTAIEVATQELWLAKEIPIAQSLVAVTGAVENLRTKIKVLDASARRMLSVCIDDHPDGPRLIPAKTGVDAPPALKVHLDAIMKWLGTSNPDEIGYLQPIRLRDYEELLVDLARDAGAAAEILGKRRKVGRPKGFDNFPLAVLIRRLRLAVVVDGGGKLSYQKRDPGKGTLIKVLELLRAHVVPELIPAKLPFSALEQMNSRKINGY